MYSRAGQEHHFQSHDLDLPAISLPWQEGCERWHHSASMTIKVKRDIERPLNMFHSGFRRLYAWQSIPSSAKLKYHIYSM